MPRSWRGGRWADEKKTPETPEVKRQKKRRLVKTVESGKGFLLQVESAGPCDPC